MRYDRDMWRRGSRSREGYSGRGQAAFGGSGLRGEYGEAYEGPFSGHGWSEGFLGGALRSRGSWDPRNPGTFEWGGGYIGGRGYGGGNYDLEHGYATGGRSAGAWPGGAAPRESDSPAAWSAERGGYSWGEGEMSEEYGPARYGYGPYFDRLRRRRRSDDELRHEVEDTLFYDTWVDADAISTTVEAGVVTLRGTLTSYEELRYAVDDAWDVDGVRGVRSELDVREGGERDSVPAGTRQESGGVSARYQPGAPHMHGHPTAGEGASSAGTTGMAAAGGRSGKRGSGTAAGGSGTAGARAGRGERGARAGGRSGRKRTGGGSSGRNAGEAGDGGAGLSQS